MRAVCLLFCVFALVAQAFVPGASFGRRVASGSALNAEVEVTFPNNKKVKVASGSLLKEGMRYPRTMRGHFGTLTRP